MSDYLYRSAERFGRSLQGLGQTIYEVDADRKYRDEALLIAQDIDGFRKGLYSDPDHGVPGSQNPDEAGYMGKWDEFSKQIEERINKIDNPLARKNLNAYWGQTTTQQRSQVFDIQYQAWAKDTVSAADKRVLEMIKTGGVSGQDAFDYAQDELGALREKNLLSADEERSRMASLSQVIIRKGLTDEAKRIHEERGLAEALLFVADESYTYTAGGQTYSAGDDVKSLVEHDIKAYHQLQQDQVNEELTRAWETYSLPAEQRKGRDFLTHEMIDKSKGDGLLRYVWHDRLFAFERSDSGGKDDQATARSILSTFEYGLYSRESAGATGATPYVKFYNPVTGKTETYESNPAGYKAMIENHWGEIAASPYAGQIFDLLKQMESGDSGPWGIAMGEVTRIKDPEGQMRAMQYMSNQRARYPDATTEQITGFLEIAKVEKASALRVMDRFRAPQTFGSADEDEIAMGIEDGVFKYHIGGDPRGKGMVGPIAWQSKETLASFEAATYREVTEALAAEGVKLEAGAYTAAWLPRSGPENDGIYDYTIRYTNPKTGVISSFRAVVAITESGKREAALLRQDIAPGAKELRGTFIQDPANPKKFYTIDPSTARRPGGWALPKEAAEAKARTVSEAETAKQKEKYTVDRWPTAVSAYPKPEGFSRLEWDREYSSLKARKKWYYDNGYTWDGKQFVKAGE